MTSSNRQAPQKTTSSISDYINKDLTTSQNANSQSDLAALIEETFGSTRDLSSSGLLDPALLSTNDLLLQQQAMFEPQQAMLSPREDAMAAAAAASLILSPEYQALVEALTPALTAPDSRHASSGTPRLRNPSLTPFMGFATGDDTPLMDAATAAGLMTPWIGDALFPGLSGESPPLFQERTKSATNTPMMHRDPTLDRQRMPPPNRRKRRSPSLVQQEMMNDVMDSGKRVRISSQPTTPSVQNLVSHSPIFQSHYQDMYTDDQHSPNQKSTSMPPAPSMYMDEGDKLAYKRMKNTEAARRSRLRKQERLQELEETVARLESEKFQIATQMAVLDNEKRAWTSRERELKTRIRELEVVLLARGSSDPPPSKN
jgi:hypothetical protein